MKETIMLQACLQGDLQNGTMVIFRGRIIGHFDFILLSSVVYLKIMTAVFPSE